VSRIRTLLVVCVIVLAGCGGLEGAPDTPSPEAATPEAETGTLTVHVLNVGQSESTLVVGPTETMLVDTGHFTDDGRIVLEYLRDLGVERIDHLVVTHADADHIGGTAAVIDYFETQGAGVGAIYDPGIAAGTLTYERYLDAVERHNVTLYETRAGDPLEFADADVSVLGPPDPYLADGERNENSVVLRVAHGAASFLLTGDAGQRQEADLVEAYGDGLAATVLKAGHHGSATSTGRAFLDAVSPALVTVSSAYDSQYGHPDEAVLDRLATRGIPAFWTATHGTIRFTSDGRTVSVATQRAAPTDPATLRAGDPVEPGTASAFEVRATIDATTGAVTPATGTPLGTAGPDAPAGPPLALVEINADAAGDDRTNLNGEFLVFENRGEETLDISGWTVADAAGRTYTVPEGVALEPGGRVTLYSGAGTDSGTALYWNATGPVWNNAGDTVTVTNADGARVLREAYR
jgi:competence protein ComEC